MSVALVILLAALSASLLFAGHGLFRFTFARCDKPYDWQSGLDEDDPIVMIRDRRFFESPDAKPVEIRSRDGLMLRGRFYDRSGAVTVLFCHGYQGGPEELTGIASPLWDKGFNVLLIYERGHKKSEGAYFTMGVRERFDIVDWIDWLKREKPDGKIVLYGWSMGASSVMGALGETLPDNVCCAVEDCGYAELFEQLVFASGLLLPRLPFRRFFAGVLDLYCRLFKGFSIRYCPAKALERCTVPVLFIHGAADALVPYDNLDRCYTACAAKKLRSSYAGAAHISSFGREPERYLNELEGFIRACTEAHDFS